MGELDGSKNEWGWSKAKLGANAILGVSMAVCKAGAAAKGLPLYKHIAELAGNPTGKMYMPVPSFNEAMKMGSEVYHNLKKGIKKAYGQDACNVGDEGGFAPNILDNKEGLNLVVAAIEAAGYTGKVKIGMDVAASEFWLDAEKKYDLDFKTENNDGSQKKTGGELMAIYEDFCENYPMISIEDPFDQDDFPSYTAMTAKLGEKAQIVGDDLLVTNPKRVQKAIDDT